MLTAALVVFLIGGLSACGEDQALPSNSADSSPSTVASLGKDLGCESTDPSRVDDATRLGVTGQVVCVLPDESSLLVTTFTGATAVEEGVQEWRAAIRSYPPGQVKPGQVFYLAAGDDWIVIPRGTPGRGPSDAVASALGGRVLSSTVRS